MTRQNYYKERKIREGKALEAEKILSWTRAQRTIQSKLGTRKLMTLMKEEEVDFQIGRDRYFDLLRAHKMLVEYDPVIKRTTNSYHTLPVFKNRLKELDVTGANQAWVSDLTYIRVARGFSYLFLISDAYSRKIVGYNLSNKMETADALVALNTATMDLQKDETPLHHSDRGCQYCSHEYTKELFSKGLSVSMTEENHCYENAKAERLNGILKQEYGLGGILPSFEVAQKVVQEAVYLYNERRPHLSLGMKKPNQIHNLSAKSFAAPGGAAKDRLKLNQNQ